MLTTVMVLGKLGDGSPLLFLLDKTKLTKELEEMLDYFSRKSVIGSDHLYDALLIESLINPEAFYSMRTSSNRVVSDLPQYFAYRKRFGFRYKYDPFTGYYKIEWPSGLVIKPFSAKQFFVENTYYMELPF